MARVRIPKSVGLDLLGIRGSPHEVAVYLGEEGRAEWADTDWRGILLVAEILKATGCSIVDETGDNVVYSAPPSVAQYLVDEVLPVCKVHTRRRGAAFWALVGAWHPLYLSASGRREKVEVFFVEEVMAHQHEASELLLPLLSRINGIYVVPASFCSSVYSVKDARGGVSPVAVLGEISVTEVAKEERKPLTLNDCAYLGVCPDLRLFAEELAHLWFYAYTMRDYSFHINLSASHQKAFFAASLAKVVAKTGEAEKMRDMMKLAPVVCPSLASMPREIPSIVSTAVSVAEKAHRLKRKLV